MIALKKRISVPTVVWANIAKWQTIRNVSDKQIAGILGLSRLTERKQSQNLDLKELDAICIYLEIEPEKLFER